MTKSEESSIIVGLDIGTHKVVAVMGEVLPDGVINVHGVGVRASKGVVNGVVVDLDAASQSVRLALEEAEYMLEDARIERIALCGSSEHITAFNKVGSVSLSNVVKQSEMERVVGEATSTKLPQGLEIMHVVADEFQVDSMPSTKNPLNLAGNHLKARVHLIACHHDWLSNLRSAVEVNKYRIFRQAFSGLASAYSVLTEHERDLGVCLIDIGAGTIDILVYTDGALRFSKVLPYGADAITSEVARVFSTSYDQAEQLKTAYGSAVFPPKDSADRRVSVVSLGGRPPRVCTRGEVASVVSKCYSEFFSGIHQLLSMVLNDLGDNKIKNELIAGIVLTGGGSQIEDIVECAKSVFGREVRIGYPLNITGLTERVNKPQYASVLGLLQHTYHEDKYVKQEHEKMLKPLTSIMARLKKAFF